MAPTSRSRRNALLICGILSSAVYVAANVVAALSWRGYSSASQTVSELSAIGAPSRSVWVPLGIAYDLLLIGFGVGVWRYAGRERGLRVTATLLVIIGAVGTLWPPMHLRGTATTLTDTVHIIFAGVVAALTLVAIGFGATSFGPRFRLYSIATLVAMVVFGVLAGVQGPRIAANLPTPWVGIAERVNIGGYLLWVVVLAVALLRRESRAGVAVSSRPRVATSESTPAT
jgi:hypothetical protein